MEFDVVPSGLLVGAGIVLVVGDPDRSASDRRDIDTVEPLSTINTISLESDIEPHRYVEIQAGCDFFHRNTPGEPRSPAAPIQFNYAASTEKRRSKTTLMVGDAQSRERRRSQIEFSVSREAGMEELLFLEDVLIANDGCNWDTVGGNSGLTLDRPGCEHHNFPRVEDPDRRTEITLPEDTHQLFVQLLSPKPASEGGQNGVSALISLAVFELLERPNE